MLKVLRRFEESRTSSGSEAFGELSEYPFHVADRGTDSYDQEMDVILTQRASRELEEIDEALRRFYEAPERFGVCEITGKPISLERLDLLPWTRTCIEPDRSGTAS